MCQEKFITTQVPRFQSENVKKQPREGSKAAAQLPPVRSATKVHRRELPLDRWVKQILRSVLPRPDINTELMVSAYNGQKGKWSWNNLQTYSSIYSDLFLVSFNDTFSTSWVIWCQMRWKLWNNMGVVMAASRYNQNIHLLQFWEATTKTQSR
jgi:hypothetical protein